MRIFISHIAPKELSRKLGISVAASNFSENLNNANIFEKCYTILPTFVKDIDIAEFSNSKFIPIFNKTIRKSPLSIFAPIIEQINLFFKIPENSSVWLYNMTSLNGYLVRMLRYFKPSVKIYEIVLDFTPGDPKAEKWLPLINACDGRILLSKSKLFNKENSACLPGIVPLDSIPCEKVDYISWDFLLSGQLSENISMLSKLLEVFKDLPEATLHITGTIPSTAIEYANNYPNIKCYQNLSYDDYLSILHSCPFILSTRNPRMPENECNFPSKIIESLLHNRIIISTLSYPQLKDIDIIKVNADNLEEEFRNLVNSNSESLLSYANQSEKVIKLFNTKVWEQTIQLIEEHAK